MPEKNELEDLKKLSPQERIKKLKELQQKNKEEIEKAQKLILESEEAVIKEEEIKKMPIPQLKSIDIDSLFTPEEKELFKTQRFVEIKNKKEAPTPKQKEKNLEEVAEEAKIARSEEERANIQYVNQLSNKPVDQLYNRIKEIYSEVKESGYVSPKQMEEINNLSYANVKKLDDIKSGKYSPNEEAAQEMVITQKIKNWLQSMYKT